MVAVATIVRPKMDEDPRKVTKVVVVMEARGL